MRRRYRTVHSSLHYLRGNRFGYATRRRFLQPLVRSTRRSRSGSKEIVMQTIQKLSFLRRVLMLDAIASGAMGVALFAFASLGAPLLGLPEQLLREAGVVLLPFAAFVGYLAS